MSDDAASLRAAIFAHPADDRPRAVYADYLQERGDRYGHFIAAQLRGDSKTAMFELQGALKATTLPLFTNTDALPKHAGLGATGKPALRCFDRGFLRACEVRSSALEHVENDAWPAIEWLHVSAPGADDFIRAIGSRLTSLHSFGCHGGAAAKVLATLRPRKLRRLMVFQMRSFTELSELIDERTELDVSGFSVRVWREAQGVKVELEGRAVPETERLLRSVVPEGAKVRVMWSTRGDPDHPLLPMVRRTLESLGAEVSEEPMFVVG
ncbi:MAG: TIGR02996 domain-containing protein [Archangium sp.]